MFFNTKDVYIITSMKAAIYNKKKTIISVMHSPFYFLFSDLLLHQQRLIKPIISWTRTISNNRATNTAAVIANLGICDTTEYCPVLRALIKSILNPKLFYVKEAI